MDQVTAAPTTPPIALDKVCRLHHWLQFVLRISVHIYAGLCLPLPHRLHASHSTTPLQLTWEHTQPGRICLGLQQEFVSQNPDC
jgi:hypothetical protein